LIDLLHINELVILNVFQPSKTDQTLEKRMSKLRRSLRIQTKSYKEKNKIIIKKKIKRRRKSKKKKRLNETPRPLGEYTEWLEDLLDNESWKNYYLYGGSDEIEPCKRIQKYKSYNNRIPDYNGSGRIEAYQARYMAQYKTIPSKYQKISHFCANPENKKKTLCIEISHMDIEPTWKNNGRKTCHCLIRKYERAERQFGNTPDGPLFANDVPIKYYNDLLRKKGMRRSKRKEIKGNNNNYSCPHGPNHCFINYTKWKIDDDDDESESK